jgi:hypothetical protein
LKSAFIKQCQNLQLAAVKIFKVSIFPYLHSVLVIMRYYTVLLNAYLVNHVLLYTHVFFFKPFVEYMI